MPEVAAVGAVDTHLPPASGEVSGEVVKLSGHDAALKIGSAALGSLEVDKPGSPADDYVNRQREFYERSPDQALDIIKKLSPLKPGELVDPTSLEPEAITSSTGIHRIIGFDLRVKGRYEAYRDFKNSLAGLLPRGSIAVLSDSRPIKVEAKFAPGQIDQIDQTEEAATPVTVVTKPIGAINGSHVFLRVLILKGVHGETNLSGETMPALVEVAQIDPRVFAEAAAQNEQKSSTGPRLGV